MKRTRFPLHIAVLVLLVGLRLTAQTQHEAANTSDAKGVPLSLEQVVSNLQHRNAQRASALEEFSGTRIYRMQYRGLPSDRDAEMVVNATYRAPDSKEFKIVSTSGSKFIIDHVFKRLLEGELEAANPENRRLTALSTDNYDFALAGYESSPEGAQYVLNLLPKSKNKFLYRGKIWVDAQDFAVVRIEGEPAKNPSFWIKKTEIKHRYIKVNDFWLPAENHTESVIRVGGRAILSIEYRDYKITKSLPVATSKIGRGFEAPRFQPVAKLSCWTPSRK
jgi:hypothetical protein